MNDEELKFYNSQQISYMNDNIVWYIRRFGIIMEF